MISSEAKRATGCRGPWDVVNLAAVWGLSQERGKEAVSTLARNLVANARLKRSGYRGVVDVVYGGERPAVAPQERSKGQQSSKKRSNREMEVDSQAEGEQAQKPISNREKKRRAKKVSLEAKQAERAEAREA